MRSSRALLFFSSILGSTASEYHHTVREDLPSILHVRSVHNPEVFSAAIRIVQTLQSSPTCNHMATLSLVNSCRSLKMDAKTHLEEGSDTEMILDEIKSEYAARLAICELTGAKVPPPSQCAGFAPSHQACKRSRFSEMLAFRNRSDLPAKLCYHEITENEFKDCLRALESKPQWWTSYSNARQNAVVICQASRDAIEIGKFSALDCGARIAMQRGQLRTANSGLSSWLDKQVFALKSLTEVASEVTSALDRSLREAQAILDKQKLWNAELFAQQDQVRAAMLQDQHEARKFQRSFVSDAAATIKALWDRFSMNWEAIEDQVGMLQQDLEEATTGARKARQNIIELLTDVHELNLRHLDIQSKRWEESIQHVDSLRSGLAETKDVLIPDLGRAIESMEDHTVHSIKQLATIDELMISLLMFVQKLQKLEQTVDATNSKSQEMFSFLSKLYAIFIQGRNIISITLVLFALASRGVVELIFKGWGRRALCGVLAAIINWPVSLTAYNAIMSNLQEIQVLFGLVCFLCLISYFIYRILRHQVISNRDGFLLPKIETSQ